MKKMMSVWQLLILLASMTTLVGFDGCGGASDDDDYDYDDSTNDSSSDDSSSGDSSYISPIKSFEKIS